jgi:hypothetical protein
VYLAGRRAKGNAANGPFSGAVTVAGRLLKKVQVQGARILRNEADGTRAGVNPAPTDTGATHDS